MRLASGLLPSENLSRQRELANALANYALDPDDVRMMARQLAALVIEYHEYRHWDFTQSSIAALMTAGNGD